MPLTRRERHNLVLGLSFIAPNVLGFLAFTIIPLGLSFVLAFSNWDLKLHNMFKDEPIRLVWFGNFWRLLGELDFWKFLGNTLFFMMGIPIAIAGSLFLAMLLSKDLSGGSRKICLWLVAGSGLVVSVVLLTLAGAGAAGMVILLGGLVCGMLVLGTAGGSTIYRTLFYLPHFVAGVPVYILWKKLYNPHTGPVNSFLDEPLGLLTNTLNATPAPLTTAGLWVCVALMALLLWLGVQRLRHMWRDGELGWSAGIAPVLFLAVPAALTLLWSPSRLAGVLFFLAAVGFLGWHGYQASKGQDFDCAPSTGFGTALMLCLGLMVAQLILLGVGAVFYHLPDMAAKPGGLQPPEWLTDYSWAKPAIMIMGFWTAVGSNNMLLYLAGLSNVPTELYEAADIDGASRLQKFWYVTWPQLAPVTFFILVMSVIGGLQGGFEMARTMTRGGPYGSTTTLSYFIYREGFETGRLGYSSAVAWALFLMVFVVTMFNWRFGNRYVND